MVSELKVRPYHDTAYRTVMSLEDGLKVEGQAVPQSELATGGA